jgi:hypothetical protein
MRKTKTKSEGKGKASERSKSHGESRLVVSIKGAGSVDFVEIDSDLQRELKLANNRLNAKGRARWLLEFAYLDLSQLSQGARSDLSYEVYAFGLTDHPTSSVDAAMLHFAAHKTDDLNKLTEDFQKEARDRFDEAIAGGAWVFQYPEVSRHLRLFHQIKIPATTFTAQNFGVNRLLKIATDLLDKEQGKFGVCNNPRCQRPFVSQRKGRVKFCSPRCSAYVRVTEKLKRDREAQEKGTGHESEI